LCGVRAQLPPQKTAVRQPVGFNPETAVGQVRVGCQGVGWQGATTQRAHARQEEQRRWRALWQRHRTCSPRTHKVRLPVGNRLRLYLYRHLQRIQRGQLPFPG